MELFVWPVLVGLTLLLLPPAVRWIWRHRISPVRMTRTWWHNRGALNRLRQRRDLVHQLRELGINVPIHRSGSCPTVLHWSGGGTTYEFGHDLPSYRRAIERGELAWGNTFLRPVLAVLTSEELAAQLAAARSAVRT